MARSSNESGFTSYAFEDMNLNQSLKISVVMPVGRIDQFLMPTLESVNAQTYRNFELILVCGSDVFDDLSDLVNQRCFDFPVQVFHTALRGVAFAANIGIANATGDLIARWDSDDLCDPDRFSRQVEEFIKDQDLSVIGTRVVLIDEKDVRAKLHGFKYYAEDREIRRALKYRQPLLHSSLMFRAKVLFDCKGYLYGHTSEDHEMFIRIARNKAAKFKNLPDVLTYYRRHSAQLSDLSNQHNQFYEISGFMFTEFLRTWNPLYIVGMAVNVPILRRLRHKFRSIRRSLAGVQ